MQNMRSGIARSNCTWTSHELKKLRFTAIFSMTDITIQIKEKKTRQLKQKLCEAHFGFLQSFFFVHNGTKVYFKLHSEVVKFIYSKNATKFCEISTLLLTTVHKSKVRWRFRKILWPSQNI